MTWTQVYDPFNNWILSTFVAALPVLVLLGLLAGLRVKAHLCALAGAATAIIVAIVGFGMPWQLAGSSFVYGMAFGLLKIVWIVIAAVYLYDLSVETGQFEIVKHSVADITSDRRLQLLLVAFCFGALIEGAAGFGTPVAIAGAFMIGLGFKPFQAAALNLIANTAPVAWGAIGTPVHTLAAVTALNESDLNAMIGRILPFASVIVPFWLVRAMVSWEETFEVLPAILVVGGSFAATQWFWSNHMDSNLVDITSGAVSMLCTLIFLKIWHPKRIWRFPDEPETPPHNYTTGQIAKAWLPFIILTVFVVTWGLPSIKGAMNKATTPNFSKGGWEVPYLHRTVSRAAPVVSKPAPENAKFDFNWLTATGTGCFLAALLSGVILGVGPATLIKVFGHTLNRLRFAILAMTCMLGLGFITRYSGMDAVLGLAFTRTGSLFPFFGTYIGWLGVALTGSDTSSNALFGGLQRITAEQLHIPPVLMCAANSAGGVMGKMIDAQSIVIATAATNQVGNEGNIFRYVFWHSVALAAIVGVIVYSYAHFFPQFIPSGLSFVH
ncbi:MAG TPA: lactate permease LctP family transporter [Candidatus Binatia bacterium]|nr:lactate permease LctP family transporter [Candidatus Binatia bacterium]